MSYFSEAEKLFNQEVRDKKRTASGVHSKTGKNGYVGKMRFPSDIMSRKDKYNYRKAGKVVTTQLYEEIIPVEEFEALDKFEQRNRMGYWRNVYTNKEITNAMGIHNNKYYKIVAELGLPKAPRVDRKEPRTSKPIKVQGTPQKAVAVEPSPIIMPEPETKPEPVQEVLVDGIHLVFSGTYSPELIQRKLAKFELILEDENDDFYIELRLIQKQKTKEEKRQIEAEKQLELLQESKRLEETASEKQKRELEKGILNPIYYPEVE
jgi:hypothetical protein